MRQWEIEATQPFAGPTLRYLVAPGASIKETHERLLRDDPIWRKPRIRVTYQRDPATEFWKRLRVTNLSGCGLTDG